MSADGAVEDAVRARLMGNAGVLALVPAANILYRQGTRRPIPSIIAGESQALPLAQDSLGITRLEVSQTWHVWKEEPTLHGVKEILGAMYEALRLARLALVGPWRLSRLDVASTRTLFDPDGKTAHGVCNLVAQVSRAAP